MDVSELRLKRGLLENFLRFDLHFILQKITVLKLKCCKIFF